MGDKTKIFAEAVDVFMAPTGTANTPASGWTIAGFCEGGKTKVSEAGRNTVPLNDDSDFKLNIKYKFEATGLETDLTKIQALEALEADDVDILLVKLDDRTKGYKLTRFTLITIPDLNFNTKEPRRLLLEATRTAKLISDFYTEVTGLSDF